VDGATGAFRVFTSTIEGQNETLKQLGIISQVAADNINELKDSFSNFPKDRNGLVIYQGPTVLEDIPKKAAGGLLPGFGGGDRRLIMAEDGEFVVNKHSTRQFLPLLRNINSRVRPRGYQDGGRVSFGDINVRESNSAQVTAREVVSEIRRGVRRGLYRLN